MGMEPRPPAHRTHHAAGAQRGRQPPSAVLADEGYAAEHDQPEGSRARGRAALPGGQEPPAEGGTAHRAGAHLPGPGCAVEGAGEGQEGGGAVHAIAGDVRHDGRGHEELERPGRPLRSAQGAQADGRDKAPSRQAPRRRRPHDVARCPTGSGGERSLPRHQRQEVESQLRVPTSGVQVCRLDQREIWLRLRGEITWRDQN
jgi:hypothetical protein